MNNKIDIDDGINDETYMISSFFFLIVVLDQE
jgi:hypothetical protein